MKALIQQVKSERLQTANPNLKLKIDVSGTADPPHATFELADGTVVRVYSDVHTSFCCVSLFLLIVLDLSSAWSVFILEMK